MNFVRLLCLYIVISTYTYAEDSQRPSGQQRPLEVQESESLQNHEVLPNKEEVAYNAGRDRTLFDRNQHLKEWEYQENWHNNRDAYYQGETPPDRAVNYPQSQENYQRPVSYQNHYSNNRQDYQPYQIYRGVNLVQPWDYGENWHENKQTRDAYLNGNNRPYHYPDIPEYRFYPPENYYPAQNNNPTQDYYQTQ